MAKTRKLSGTVTSLPGELPMLVSVVANLADDNHKLVYADWLEERNDPRGPHLRAIMQAVQNGGKLPSSQGISPAWEEMCGAALLRRLHKAGVIQHRVQFLARTRPALALETKLSSEKSLHIGCTKFGGNPDLPKGTPWPRGHGDALEFLAQFDLAEIHQTVAGQALPAKGLLSFFIHRKHTDDPEPGGVQIIHTRSLTKLTRQTPPEDYVQGFAKRSRPCRVIITELLDIAERLGSWMKELGETAVELRKIKNDVVERIRSSDHQLFGHTHVCVLAENPSPGPEWQPLIRFTSDSKLNWCWQDDHWLLWFIKTANLERATFTDTEALDV